MHVWWAVQKVCMYARARCVCMLCAEAECACCGVCGSDNRKHNRVFIPQLLGAESWVGHHRQGGRGGTPHHLMQHAHACGQYTIVQYILNGQVHFVVLTPPPACLSTSGHVDSQVG